MRILLLGGSGRLGAALRRRLGAGHEVTAPGRSEVDLAASDAALRAALGRFPAELVINAAGATNVDQCQRDLVWAERLNFTAVRTLAHAVAGSGARLLHFSTDYVFAGDGDGTPLSERATAAPISVYGRTKRSGEEAVLAADRRHLVARVCWLFGPDKPAFPETVQQAARSGGTLSAVTDKWSTPTSCEDIAAWLGDLLARGGLPSGLLHLCNSGGCSWLEYAREVLRCLRQREPSLTHDPLVPTPLSRMRNFRAERPPQTILSNARLTELLGYRPRTWQEALAEHLRRDNLHKAGT